MNLEWQMEVSQKLQNGEWENMRHLGEDVDRLVALLQALKDYAPTLNTRPLTMTSPVYLKAVLRVQQSSEESFFGHSVPHTTSKSEAKTKP